MISPSQIDFFHQNGYLRYGRVLNAQEVALYRAGLDRTIREEMAGGRDDEPEFQYGHRRAGAPDAASAPRAITQYINMWKRDDAYRNLLHHPVIAGVAQALLGTEQIGRAHV